MQAGNRGDESHFLPSSPIGTNANIPPSGSVEPVTHRRRATIGHVLSDNAPSRQIYGREMPQGRHRSSAASNEHSRSPQFILPRLSAENLSLHSINRVAPQELASPGMPVMMELDASRDWSGHSPLQPTTMAHHPSGPLLHPVAPQNEPDTQLWSAEDRRQKDQLHKSLQL